MQEFEIIKSYFATQAIHRSDVKKGIGDDCAITTVPENHELLMSIDTLVSGVHFPNETSPEDIGYKSLAVNLSDLAAMGAEPAWVTLALTLPNNDEAWLKEFSKGFFELANKYNVQLIGGDTTRGPLSITVQAHGFTPIGKAVRRDGAKVGDKIYVTGTLGDAGFALKNKSLKTLLQKLNRPEPRVAAGLVLRDVATTMIDISDGLKSDLNHILDASQVGATINVDNLPLSDEYLANVSEQDKILLALTAGDDYELCFSAPKDAPVEATLKRACKVTCVGIIEDKPGLRLQNANGEAYELNIDGFQHF